MFAHVRTLLLGAALTISSVSALAAQDRPTMTLAGPGGRLGAPCSGFAFGATVARDASGNIYTAGLPHVTRVSPDSPASDAGFMVGDTIVTFDGRLGTAPGALKLPEPGTQVVVKIKRGAKDTTLTLTAGRMADAGASGLTYDAAAPATGGVSSERLRCASSKRTESRP